MNVALEQAINRHEFRVVDATAHISDLNLALFASDVFKGRPLDKYCSGVSVDQALRTLAYSSVLRELRRREEAAALEDEAAGA